MPAAASAAAVKAEAQAPEAKRSGEASRRKTKDKARPQLRLASVAEPAIARKPLGLQRSALLSSTRIQPALMLSQPGDASEQEADRVAAHVVAMPEPAPRASAGGGGIQRSPLIVQRAPAAAAPTPDNVADPATEAAVKKEMSGGSPMAPDVAGFFGRRFNADFSGVRIHTDGKAENLSTRLGARAFTYGRHVFFNAGQYNPDTEDGSKLIAHELTHTIQQQAAIQLKESEAPRVNNRSERRAQRGIVSKALNWIADKANYIPGFRLFTIVIGVNPINMSMVERSGANILRALIEFIPGGGLIVDALNNHGIFEKGGKFIEDQFRSLGMVGAAFRDALMEFIDSLGWRDIFHLGDVWDRAKRIFTAPVVKLIDFGKGLVTGIAKIVKDAILKPLGRYAASVIPKWDLLVGVFGKNPVSDEGQSPAAALIGAFMELIGQKEIWDNIQKSGAVGKAWKWFKDALSGALALVKSLPGRFMDTLRSLTIFDIVTIVGAWVKFAKLFGGFVVDFIKWAGGTVLQLLEIILEVVAPSVIPYLKKAGAAFKTIIKAPGRFIGNLVKAGKAGFNQFKNNILDHLKRGIFDWLLGSIAEANIYIPRSFDLKEILKFGLSVVGLTWANIRAKLVAATNETVVATLEAGFDLVKTLVTQGPMAAWQQFLEQLSNLKQMAMDAIIDFIKGEVIRVAIEKVVSMLVPAAAFIQALLSIYRTVMFVVNEIKRIAAVVAAIIDGISAIANGVIGAAANRVENILAKGLSLAISFLANFAGLGNVSKKVVEIVKKIRAPVDKALDKVIGWIIDQAKKLGKMVMAGGKSVINRVLKAVGVSLSFSAGDESHRLWVDIKGEPRVMMASTPKKLSTYLGEFQTKADKLKGKKKTDTTKAITAITPTVNKIEKLAKEAKDPAVDEKAATLKDREITSLEQGMQVNLILILNNLKVEVPDKIDPAIVVPFQMGDKLTPAKHKAEYTRQLAMQQSNINGMAVSHWLRNRSRFEDRGRDPDSAKTQADLRSYVTTDMVSRLTEAQNSKTKYKYLKAYELAAIAGIFASGTDDERANGFGLVKATNRATSWMATQRALHSPDQVAGGDHDELTGMGLTAVNSSIGSNWGKRKLADKLQTDVEAWLNGTGPKRPVEEAFWSKCKMNVRLTI
ncbi:MAG: DUF4157 domain-containing protein [Sphingomonadales bacterium]|nr:DUF4157 domain-containing protein [Sphingomonadales bacterium]